MADEFYELGKELGQIGATLQGFGSRLAGIEDTQKETNKIVNALFTKFDVHLAKDHEPGNGSPKKDRNGILGLFRDWKLVIGVAGGISGLGALGTFTVKGCGGWEFHAHDPGSVVATPSPGHPR